MADTPPVQLHVDHDLAASAEAPKIAGSAPPTATRASAGRRQGQPSLRKSRIRRSGGGGKVERPQHRRGAVARSRPERWPPHHPGTAERIAPRPLRGRAAWQSEPPTNRPATTTSL